MRVLLTGGAGYIGSHTYLALMSAGFEPIIFDNFSNASKGVVERLHSIANRRPEMIVGDVHDRDAVIAAINDCRPDAVIHLAGAKAVGESAVDPLKYYANNVTGSQVLLSAMQHCGLKRIVFSSSATVYGDPVDLPITERHPLSATNTYGATKLVVEDMLRAVSAAHDDWSVVILRYFNPAGAHPSGDIGEDPRGIPNNLLPIVSQVAVGRRQQVFVFGDDYATPDGTGVRDYIHVMDLADGHVAALRLLGQAGCHALNLGTGRGHSVLEIIRAFERASGCAVPYQVVGRRPGDVAASYADASLAEGLLGWRAQRGLREICLDAWRWQSRNPNGFGAGP